MWTAAALGCVRWKSGPSAPGRDRGPKGGEKDGSAQLSADPHESARNPRYGFPHFQLSPPTVTFTPTRKLSGSAGKPTIPS
jgi:hypothetical protein